MKTLSKDTSASRQNAVTIVVALVIGALVPTVGILWFMAAAMRNERLAVQERLATVYLNHLNSLQRQLTSFWQERQAALVSDETESSAQAFARIVRARLADSVIVFGGPEGKLSYPFAPGVVKPVVENGEWSVARELEFQKLDFSAAAARYGRIAEATTDIHARARALQAQAGCLLKAGRKDEALRRLSELGDDASLRHAVNAQGTLIGPNAQLLILQLLTAVAGSAGGAVLQPASGEGETRTESPRGGQAEADLRRRTLDDLVRRLNQYYDSPLSASQRQFLMAEVRTLAPEAGAFPTMEAEAMAADYLDHDPVRPTELKLQRTLLEKVWRLTSTDGTLVALFREERLRAELATVIGALTLPDALVTLLAPGEERPAGEHVPSVDASEMLPGWRLALSFNGLDPLASASERQSRFYLWIGVVVVAIIGVLALMIARLVGAQMRLARIKDELVSTVSHELKTPLASMRALVDTLAAGRFRDERQLREYLQLIAKENVRLTQVIENFLAFSRMEHGQQRFQFQALAPAELVRAAVEVLQEKLKAPNCRLEITVPPDSPRVWGDVEALATVLINLLDNACKYTNGEKRIAVRVLAERGAVWFELEDNGIGIAPEETRKIFDRFYQVDQSLTRKRGGCGLGLSIVKSIVEAHRGAVEVRSEPGKGSTFRVKIPMASQSAVAS